MHYMLSSYKEAIINMMGLVIHWT